MTKRVGFRPEAFEHCRRAPRATEANLVGSALLGRTTAALATAALRLS